MRKSWRSVRHWWRKIAKRVPNFFKERAFIAAKFTIYNWIIDYNLIYNYIMLAAPACNYSDAHYTAYCYVARFWCWLLFRASISSSLKPPLAVHPRSCNIIAPTRISPPILSLFPPHALIPHPWSTRSGPAAPRYVTLLRSSGKRLITRKITWWNLFGRWNHMGKRVKKLWFLGDGRNDFNDFSAIDIAALKLKYI